MILKERDDPLGCCAFFGCRCVVCLLDEKCIRHVKSKIKYYIWG